VVCFTARRSLSDLQPRNEVTMWIPENGMWRWNDGPLCVTKEEAIKTAKVKVSDSSGVVFVDEMTEVLEEEEDDAEGE
jgi:ATP-dependent protease HslVU (ClpYQ) ATPase subunit